ncbi:tryptophanyl-tRNA synthetase [Trichocladium antarcticum]|uniref:Small ribosomal subunit protein uS10m n=1 Tax=Trichocladium antarcticum TaxID=1450529 RepID=A0AAN6ZFF1_9PEZI|nr:tryptophanyl-tRNA synthetase [Trichocladium antarcticum]
MPNIGLADDEIDRLLAEAEVRLAGAGSADAVAVVPASTALATVAAAAAANAGDQTAVSDKKPEKLTVRVPQLAQKQKGPKDTLGSDWYNLPRTNLTPELKRDLQLLRMRDVVAMGKQFFKKETRKDFVPEYSQVGTIIAGATDGANSRLTRKERKRTIVEEVLSGENLAKFKGKYQDIQMNPPRLIRPLRPLLQGQLPLAVSRSSPVGIPRVSTQIRTNASISNATTAALQTPENAAAAADQETRVSRMPRALEALYLKPLRREAEYGVPSCDLQLRSYSVRNLEFFCDFALRAAYYLGLPAFGPVPLPRMTKRWTVPKSTFIFKKSQENFERITLRRLIQIRDGHPETVQVWLAFLQKHAYYGIGMKANVWEFSKLGVGKDMDASVEQTEQLLEDKWQHLGYLERRKEHKPYTKGPGEQLPKAADVEEFLASERRRIAGGRRAGEKRIIFSAIQPTGVPHLGNYLGALREWKRLQDNARPGDELIFSIVDLHAITVPRGREELVRDKTQMLAALLAIGLDPNRCTIFFQSRLAAISELQWILSCTASTGYLSRMTQWKAGHGLFSYPILMAADILVHRATHVPVGDDQCQHLEFARECVTNFNHTYKTDCLVAPETLVSPAKRIMSLTDPTKKMSKSDPAPKSRLLLTDTREDIASRINGAVTDSAGPVTYDPVRRPGVANLLEILSGFDSDGRTPQQLAEAMAGEGMAELKRAVKTALCEDLGEIRDKYLQFLGREALLAEIEADGMRKARASAATTMRDVSDAVGLSNGF